MNLEMIDWDGMRFRGHARKQWNQLTRGNVDRTASKRELTIGGSRQGDNAAPDDARVHTNAREQLRNKDP